MIKITKKQYNAIHPDFRGVWSRSDEPQCIGKRTAFESSLRHAAGLPPANGPLSLLIEGFHFEIVDDVFWHPSIARLRPIL